MLENQTPSASGPLRVSTRNPRYFEDAEGRIVYLTGSHTHLNLIDKGYGDPPPRFNYEEYLAFLQRHNHNFIRLWTWQTAGDPGQRYDFNEPLPWARTGPGLALDGKPKFDLTQYNPEYFARLRSRIIEAGGQGIYVSVMLFEGWVTNAGEPPWNWDSDPFHGSNNVNGIDGDPERAGHGRRVHTLDLPAITAAQEAYLRKVVDTVGDLDNVLFEIINEAGAYSVPWQYHMIRCVHEYEKTKPKQHPVGMVFFSWGAGPATNEDLFTSEAEWISPGDGIDGKALEPYVQDPPAADGSKVILSDSDHLTNNGTETPAWVWKSFCRGLQPILMEFPYVESDDSARLVNPRPELTRRNMGYARMYAERMSLAEAVPSDDLSSTTYCLSDRKSEYLVFVPELERPFVTVDLSGASGFLNAEWLDPNTGQIMPVGQVKGGRRVQLLCPFVKEGVLYLWATGR